MGKKVASKGREWEKGRRDILNQTFHELHKALPSFVDGQTVSKKTILTQALACIHQYQQEKKAQEVQEHSQSKSTALQKWVQHILSKFSELLSYLNSLNVTIPSEYLSINAPPSWISPDITLLLKKIEIGGDNSSTQKNGIQKKKKTDPKKKGNPTNSTSAVSKTNVKGNISPVRNVTGQTEMRNHVPKPTSNSNIHSPILRSNSLLVQQSPLQVPSQLLFASNSPSTPLSSSLPLLVSVTGVKTVNPFILVQSNAMTPNPLPSQNIVTSSSNARPIQPCPPDKAAKKVRKIPIPSLKQKAVSLDVSTPSTIRKLIKKNSTKIKPKPSEQRVVTVKKVKSQKTLKAKLPPKIVSSKVSKVADCLKDDRPNDKANSNQSRCGNGGGTSETEKKTSININHDQNSKPLSDVDKENVASTSKSSKQECYASKVKSALQAPSAVKDALTPTKCSDTVDTVKDVSARAVNTKALQQPIHNKGTEVPTRKEDKGIKVLSDSANLSSSSKRHCNEVLTTSDMKRQKCDEDRRITGNTNLDNAVNLGNICANSSPVKIPKSNYSISALCAQQQKLLQNSEIISQASDSGHLQQEDIVHKSTMSQISKADTHESRLRIASSQETSVDKDNRSCCNQTKSKEASSLSGDLCSDWQNKPKQKTDRMCTSYSYYSNLPIHTNKNSFIPISDIDSFKTVPESFDSADSSFGLPLHSADISNDLFASLQVPTGGQHPESISPTAAFLLAFPLVSTSKASELMSEETVCENNDSQPGMKTILQIGNLDCDTPVTKCVSEFSSMENNNVIYSSSNDFNQDSLSVAIGKTKSVNSSADIRSFIQKQGIENTSQKSNDVETVMSAKNGVNFAHKNSESLVSVKQCENYLSKADFQPQFSNTSKQHCLENGESLSIVPEANQLSGQLGISRERSKQNESQLSTTGIVIAKPPSKVNTSHESSTFLTCDKQADWIEMPHSSQTTFSDYSLSNPSRPDCAVNYVLPPVLMSSTSNGEDLVSSARSQTVSSSAGIISWSTFSPSDSSHSLKQNPKLGHLHDIFPGPKPASKSLDGQQILPDPVICPTVSEYAQSASSSGLAVSNKLDSIASNFNQNLHIVSSSKLEISSNYNPGVLLNQKQGPSSQQSSSSNIFMPTERNLEAKKTFPVTTERKQATCNSSEVVKSASNQGETAVFSNRPSNHRQVTTQPSSSSMMLTSDGKAGKSSNIYCVDGTLSQNLKTNVDAITSSHNVKQSISVLNYNQSNAASDIKQTSSVSVFSQRSISNVKETVGQNHQMNPYNHQTSNLPKQHVVDISNQYASGSVVPGLTEAKKNTSHFHLNNDSLMAGPKQTAPVLNFTPENAPSMIQCNSTPIIASADLQQPYNKPNGLVEVSQVKEQQTSSSHQGQHRHTISQHQEQQCGRSNNKESVTNLHRPPVNWMTAPDIRSHQHHSGPSFGNSGSVSNSQSLLYLPEHMKDTDGTSNMFDQTTNFHSFDISHSGQPLHLFGNESIENFHDNSAWSPSKSGGSSMLGNMMIPSTLPTLVGDLALGDNNISRPFLPSYSNDPSSCNKKSSKRALHSSRRGDKAVEEGSVASGQECAGSFLSVSQLVDNGNTNKSRTGSLMKENNISFPGPFPDHDSTACQSTKQSSSKPVSSNYSTEALLSSSSAQPNAQLSHRRRRAHGAHFTNNYVGGSTSYQNTGGVGLQAQGPQTQFFTELPPPRSNDYQSTFLHADGIPSFMLGNPSRPHRNHSYSLQNIADRPSVEENSNSQRIHHSTPMSDHSQTGGSSAPARHRTSNSNSVVNSSTSVAVTSSSNIMDFGYINMPPAVLQDDINFTPHPPFLPHHSYSMPGSQEALYTAPRLSIHPGHPPQNSNVQSLSATTLTNFHLSTIFPEINEKVLC